MQQQLALICCCLSTSILTNYVPRLESPAEPNNNCTQASHDAVAATSSQKAERKFQKETKKEKKRERDSILWQEPRHIGSLSRTCISG